VRLIVVDSIQGDGLAAGATKAYAKVLEFARLCAGSGITVLLVSHVTKRGDLAGPKTLEHGVDVTLVLRRVMLYSLLAVRKNRFGPTLLRPLPLTVDRRTLRMGPTPHAHARPGAAWAYSEGAGPTQVQASVAVPPDGRPGRMTAPGLPRREIEQLVACVGQIEGLELGDLDYRIQCRLPGGSGQYLTWFGLPLCMALIGSFIRRDVPKDYVYLGEIDLFHAIQPIPPTVLDALSAGIASGQVPLPVTLLVPPSAVAQLPSVSGRVRVVPCRTLEEAVRQTWPDLWPSSSGV
jgi:DNA repair protein RadA/Sms